MLVFFKVCKCVCFNYGIFIPECKKAYLHILKDTSIFKTKETFYTCKMKDHLQLISKTSSLYILNIFLQQYNRGYLVVKIASMKIDNSFIFF